MKIIKQPDTSWLYKHICRTCDAELEIEKGDVKFKSYLGDQRDPGYESWTANCPVCKSAIDIPAGKLPKIVQLEIKNGLYIKD